MTLMKKNSAVITNDIGIDKISSDVIGFDELKIKNNGSIRYSIRFHLYPGIDASLTLSGKSVT